MSPFMNEKDEIYIVNDVVKSSKQLGRWKAIMTSLQRGEEVHLFGYGHAVWPGKFSWPASWKVISSGEEVANEQHRTG